MDDDAHSYLFARKLNPSLTERPAFERSTPFDFSQSVAENCWNSEIKGLHGGELGPAGGGRLDGDAVVLLVADQHAGLAGAEQVGDDRQRHTLAADLPMWPPRDCPVPA